MRLEEINKFIDKKFKNRNIIVVSYTEPYVNFVREGKVEGRKGSGGLVTALEPIVRMNHGVWVAPSPGGADRLTVDEKGRIKVPPQNPQYVLKRVFLSKEEMLRYINFSDRALWPLSHPVFVKPHFTKKDFEAYKKVNKKIAENVIEEAGKNSVVWVQDYQLTLCSKYIKEKRPDLLVGFFWHIPFAPVEIFKANKYKEEILEGMLANDVVGFHFQAYAENFINCVNAFVETRYNPALSSFFYKEHETKILSVPASVDFEKINRISLSITKKEIEEIKKKHSLEDKIIGIGADRLDYIKGIPEKAYGISYFLKTNPEFMKKFVFVQLLAPSRTAVPEYKETFKEIKEAVEKVNEKYERDGWKPIILLYDFFTEEEIVKFYKLSDFCLITSLSDGLNLVAKEYIASKNDNSGALILSKFAGVSYELPEAILVNPYSTGEIGIAIKKGLEMSKEEKKEKMKKMRARVREHDAYRWSVEFLNALLERERYEEAGKEL